MIFLKDLLAESKFDPFESKELLFVTYGGLSLNKQKGFNNSDPVSFHSPPARRGIYAFVFPYIEKFLLGGGSLVDPKERGKGQRNRIEYVKDKDGNPIDSKHPEFDKLSKIPKNWTLTRVNNSDEFSGILYRNSNRKKFRYNGNLWHHLMDVPEWSVIDRKGDWVKTDMNTFKKAFRKDIGMTQSKSLPIKYTKDHLEVFIDEKI